MLIQALSNRRFDFALFLIFQQTAGIQENETSQRQRFNPAFHIGNGKKEKKNFPGKTAM